MRFLSFLLVLALAAACGTTGQNDDDVTVEYSVSAKQNYDRGMERLEDEEWAEAAKYFAFVKARFPYSKFAVLADLRLADAQFGAGAYLEAVDAYKLFEKFHPTHEMVDNGYASFRVGEAYYKMLPDDWFLVPPSYEKDQTATNDALRELGHFLRRYPKSPYLEKAEKMYAECAHRLAETEWYVANFYWDRNRPMGTVLRLRTLLKKYPGVGYDEDALWLLGKAYVKVGRNDDARATFETLIDKYPKSDKVGAAKDKLQSLPAPKASAPEGPAVGPGDSSTDDDGGDSQD